MFSIFLIFFNFFFFVVFLIYLLILLSNFFQIKQNYKRKSLFNSFYFLKCLFNILVLLHIFVLCPAIDHLLMSPNLQHIYFTHALLLLLLLCRFEKLTPCTAFHCYLINFPQKHQRACHHTQLYVQTCNMALKSKIRQLQCNTPAMAHKRMQHNKVRDFCRATLFVCMCVPP